MKFQAESDLVETLKTCLRSKYTRSSIEILEEVSVGYGIADIVITELKKDYISTKSCENSLDSNDINIFSIVREAQSTTIKNIINTTRCSRRVVLLSLKKLLANGYITQAEDDLSIKEDYELNFIHNFAIEAKLKDWKKALKQAYRYKWFAEYSFVVLDAHYSKPALKNIDIFEKYNVGLASVTVDGKLKRHFNPKKEMPLDPNMQMLLSEKIKHYELAK